MPKKDPTITINGETMSLDAAALLPASQLVRVLLDALALLGDTLNTWENEEDSVKEEHAEHIAELDAFTDLNHN